MNEWKNIQQKVHKRKQHCSFFCFFCSSLKKQEKIILFHSMCTIWILNDTQNNAIKLLYSQKTVGCHKVPSSFPLFSNYFLKMTYKTSISCESHQNSDTFQNFDRCQFGWTHVVCIPRKEKNLKILQFLNKIPNNKILNEYKNKIEKKNYQEGDLVDCVVLTFSAWRIAL